VKGRPVLRHTRFATTAGLSDDWPAGSPSCHSSALPNHLAGENNGPVILGNDMPGWLVTACHLTDGVVDHAVISAAHRANSIGCCRD
jgi:hypothetical protein